MTETVVQRPSNTPTNRPRSNPPRSTSGDAGTTRPRWSTRSGRWWAARVGGWWSVRSGVAFAVAVAVTFLAAQPASVSEARAQTAGESALSTDAEAPNDAAEKGSASASSSSSPDSASPSETVDKPWDYDPYRVLVWIASSTPDIDADAIETPLRTYLRRDFDALWRVDIADAPASIRAAAFRQMDSLDFDDIVASDPVIAVKKTHPDAIRIRFPSDINRYVANVLTTAGRAAEIERRGSESELESLRGIAGRLKVVEGDAAAVKATWENESTEALLIPHGMASLLVEPEAKIIPMPGFDAVGDLADRYDKVFIVRIDRDEHWTGVQAVELETLMQLFGDVVETDAATADALPAAVGRAITDAFAPTIRIEDSGTRTTRATLRAGGLILDERSPAAIRVGDLVMPMLRKNDRNGDPTQIGRLDWAYLLVNEVDGAKLEMELFAGRAGGLQGRKNSRTFRTGLKVKPHRDETLLRLHARGESDRPLAGYEIYEKELDSNSMTLVGRTDWDGRLRVKRTDHPLRLLYVKNGGAVLARLPMAPGFTELEVADLSGDDMRLRAEAYIRGVQNAIIDLVAIRELLKARIRLRLEKGEFDQAQDLLNRLRDQPTNEIIANDMGRKQTMFLTAVGRNANQRRKIDNLFSETRELLAKHINAGMVRDLEAEVRQARDGS